MRHYFVALRFLLLGATALSLVGIPVKGYRITLNRETLSIYNADSYRQSPYYRMGIFSRDSVPAHISGHSDTQASLAFDIRVSDAPHGFLQAFVYHISHVEGAIVPSLQRPHVHPCIDAGQQKGVALFPNMTDWAFTVDSTYVKMDHTVDAEGNPRDVVLRGEVYIRETGMYVVSFNGCRYVPVGVLPNGTSYGRRLDVSDWYKARLTGTISLRNPYGYLLGQTYGRLPTYVALFIISAATLATYAVACCRAGWRLLFRYQLALLAAAVACTVAYGLLVGYYSVLNSANQDSYPLYVVASMGLLLRSALSRAVLFVLSGGWGVTHVRLAHSRIVVVAILTVSYLAMSVALFALQELDRPEVGGVDPSDVPQAAIVTVQSCVTLLEGLFVLLTWLQLRRTLHECALAREQAKKELFHWCAYVLVVYAWVGGCWWLWTTFATSGVGSTCLDNWESWWVRPAVWEALYMMVLVTMLAIFRPTRQSQYYAYGAQLATDGDDAVQMADVPTTCNSANKIRSGTSAVSAPTTAPHHRDERDEPTLVAGHVDYTTRLGLEDLEATNQPPDACGSTTLGHPV